MASMDLKQQLLNELEKISLTKTKEETKSNFNPKYDAEHYENLFWSSTNYDDVEKIQLKLIFVENDDQRDLFDYIRHRVSSMPQCQVPGRVLSVLVYDQYFGQYLGIMQLTTDLLKSEQKDMFMNLDDKKRGQLKHHIRDHSANLAICVPVQPFGFNFCGGKLLAMLAFSIEIHSFYDNRYSNRLALITTTSIHGKSVQYDRLKQLKFIGYTKGFGISHIPKSFIEKAIQYFKIYHPEYRVEKQANWQILKTLAQKLNIDSKLIFFHGQQRGIYCGWTGAKANEFLLKKQASFKQDKLQPANEICEFWKNRWAKQRCVHLNSEQKLLLVNNEYSRSDKNEPKN